MTTYERIKEICDQRKMSIRQLEIRCSIANGTVRKWTDRKPNSATLFKVAECLGVTPEYLLGVQKNEQKVYYNNPMTALKAQELYLEGIAFDAGRNATPEELEMVAQMIRTLKAKNEDG